MMNERTVKILGIDFIHTTMKGFVEKISYRIMDEKKTFVITANPEIVMYAQKDSFYKSILGKADFITPDGIGIILASSLVKDPLPERVTGFELMLELLKYANEKQLKIYLLGAQENTLVKTISHIEKNYPNAQIVGSHHGFFDWEDNKIPQEIQLTRPDLIFVALGFPRQEKWIYEHIDQFDKGVFIGIGGSFDVLSGNVKRAPEIWQKLNVEWLYRLIKQPSRWRRMLALPEFAFKVLLREFPKVKRK